MCKLLIFGGTTEGRVLAEFCTQNGISATVSVTTDYGAELLPESPFLKVCNGKLDKNEISRLIMKNGFSVVIDATHPYAVLATENICLACAETGAKYYRLKRESNQLFGTVLNSLDEMTAYLNKSNKMILSTLGSKEIPALSKVINCRERVWVRVLPADGIVEYCKSYGIDESRIILGKGPFTAAQNIEHIKKSGAEILVTKESGAAGGYPEKVKASEQSGVELVTIKRPLETGNTIDEIKKIIIKELR